MKNKILLLIILLNLALATSVLAQQKPLDFSVKVYGGYGIIAPNGDYFTAEAGTANAEGNEVAQFAYNNVKYKLGQLPHFGAGVNLKLNDLISVGLDADYMTGSHKSTYSFSNTSGYVSTSDHVVSLIPNITYQVYKNSMYSIYNTLGIITAVNTKLHVLIVGARGDDQTDTFGVNLGIKDAAGIKMQLAPRIQGFAEFQAFLLSQGPKTRTITADGDITIQKFKTSGSVNDSTSGNVETITLDPTDPYHFSSFGINIGVIISLKK